MTRNFWFAASLFLMWSLSHQPEGVTATADNLGLGQKYEVIGELYAHYVSTDLDSRKLSVITLVPLRLSGPEILDRKEVPKGSVLIIVGKVPKRFFAFLYPDEYFVQINALDLPVSIPVIISLSRGIEGKRGALNPTIFRLL